jgi:acyl dehydratase
MLDTSKVMAWPFAEVEHEITTRDALLYALSLGYGEDPLDESELRFVFEQDLKVVPSVASVIAHPSLWLRNPETGVDWTKVVHGEQNIEFHRPFPRQGRVLAQPRIIGVADKGQGKGATILMENRLRLKEDGEPLATITRTSFCRADGGCGSAGTAPEAPPPTPSRPPDEVVSIRTQPRQALLYRLNGDYNPLHADPATARRAGFDRPILHGLCTYGMACRAILASQFDNDPARLSFLGCRFTAPVFPGETLETHIWREGDVLRFETHVPERGTRVLGAGVARGSLA